MRQILLCALTLAAVGMPLALHAQDANACSRADAALGAGQWEPARGLYASCLAADPNNFGALSNMGVALSRLGRMQEAVESYQKALALKPDDAKIEFNLAVGMIRENDCGGAVEHLNHLLAANRDPRFEELLAFCYYHLGSYALAARAAERVQREQPDDAANALILGSAYTRLGQYDKALPLITQALKAAGSAEGQLIMAETLLGLHKYREALDDLQQAAAQKPDLPGLQTEFGVAYVGLNKTPEATAAFTAALAKDANDYQANYFMGRIKRLDGDYPAARTYLEVANRLQPESTEVLFEFAALDVAERKFADAVPKLEKVIAAEPDHAEAYLLLSTSYARTGQREKAQKTGETYNRLRREAEDAARTRQSSDDSQVKQ